MSSQTSRETSEHAIPRRGVHYERGCKKLRLQTTGEGEKIGVKGLIGKRAVGESKPTFANLEKKSRKKRGAA